MSGSLGPTIYIRFDGEVFCVLDANSLATHTIDPVVAIRKTGRVSEVVEAGPRAEGAIGPGVVLVDPFAHSRLVVHEFEAAAAIIRYGIASVSEQRSLVRPHLVLHPLRSLPDGLTDIEHRALTEAGIAAGARSVSVHMGTELTPPGVLALAAGGRGRGGAPDPPKGTG